MNSSGSAILYLYHCPESPRPKFDLGGDDSPPNFGGKSSKITCFTVFIEGRSLNLGGEIFTPQIWGVWVLRVEISSPQRKLVLSVITFQFGYYGKPMSDVLPASLPKFSACNPCSEVSDWVSEVSRSELFIYIYIYMCVGNG